jgi:2-(1,2-epoxy-1,2-dihydrophenyl)acetyl-CoA isomerase
MAGPVILQPDPDGVARITLNRPEVGNAIDLPMAQALLEAAIVCDADPDIRCVLLTGAGRFFCTGGDVAAFADAGPQLPVFLKEITDYLHAAMGRLMRMPKPLVTAINGPAAGAGIGLAVMGDFALAAPKTHFTLAYTGLGLSPDGGATWLLPRIVGMRRAQELCLLNERIDASGAAEIGLVTRVAEADALDAEAMSLARRLAAGPSLALGATRRLLLDSLDAPLEAQLEAESRSIAALSRTPDGLEGVAAYLERRPARFKGKT